MIYGQPNSGGPTRFIQYSRDELLNHLITVANKEGTQHKIVADSANYQVNVTVDGVLAATVFAAVLIRVANVPLANVYYDKDLKALIIGYDDKKHKEAFISCVHKLFNCKAVLDLKQDPWGNNLFTGGRAVV